MNPPLPGYAVRFQSVAVRGGLPLEIRALLDRQQYADPDGAAAAVGISPACWSLFGQVWPSAQKLADLMQDWDFASARMLEIGCGLGLASLVLHRRGGNITASDCHPLAAEFLAQNVARNALTPLPYQAGHWDRANPALGRFDLIIGSDILYERNHPQQLVTFIESHSEPVARILIVDPNRSNRSAFNRGMDKLGFDCTETRIETPLSDGSAYRGRLLDYRRG